MRMKIPWSITRYEWIAEDAVITLPDGVIEIGRDAEGITLEFADDFEFKKGEVSVL